MKFSKIYQYTLHPVILLFFITSIRYLLKKKSIFTTEHIAFCVIGGLVVGGLWYLVDWYKIKKKITDSVSIKLEGK